MAPDRPPKSKVYTQLHFSEPLFKAGHSPFGITAASLTPGYLKAQRDLRCESCPDRNKQPFTVHAPFVTMMCKHTRCAVCVKDSVCICKACTAMDFQPRSTFNLKIEWFPDVWRLTQSEYDSRRFRCIDCDRLHPLNNSLICADHEMKGGRQNHKGTRYVCVWCANENHLHCDFRAIEDKHTGSQNKPDDPSEEAASFDISQRLAWALSHCALCWAQFKVKTEEALECGHFACEDLYCLVKNKGKKYQKCNHCGKTASPHDKIRDDPYRLQSKDAFGQQTRQERDERKLRIPGLEEYLKELNPTLQCSRCEGIHPVKNIVDVEKTSESSKKYCLWCMLEVHRSGEYQAIYTELRDDRPKGIRMHGDTSKWGQRKITLHSGKVYYY